MTVLLISAQEPFRLELYANSPRESLVSHELPGAQGRIAIESTICLLAEFEFDLPEELIAQHPIEPRDQSRLMVVDRRRECWEHRAFVELPELLRCGDVLVRNNSRVIPARLVGHRASTSGKWEGLFLREVSEHAWEILAMTRGRPVPGEHVIVGQGLHLVLESKTASGSWIVRPQWDEN